MFIQILQELYDGGADFVDISGNTDINGVVRDTLKITVKPEYLSDFHDDDVSLDEELNLECTEEESKHSSSKFSDENINDLI